MKNHFLPLGPIVREAVPDQKGMRNAFLRQRLGQLYIAPSRDFPNRKIDR
jgi:hypothetical protein